MAGEVNTAGLLDRHPKHQTVTAVSLHTTLSGSSFCQYLCPDSRVILTLIFFFSSRRRHTRFDCDWSSDVCSSDLAAIPVSQPAQAGFVAPRRAFSGAASAAGPLPVHRRRSASPSPIRLKVTPTRKIGRASCRERV